TRLPSDAPTLEGGAIPPPPAPGHAHCAPPGLSDRPPVPIFADDHITLQVISRISISFSTALLGFVEASGRSTEEKNRLLPPNPWPHTPFDWTRHLLHGMRTETEWTSAPDIMAWVDASRLNLVRGLEQDPDTARVADLQGRFLVALFPALARLDEFAASASTAERARMFQRAA